MADPFVSKPPRDEFRGLRANHSVCHVYRRHGQPEDSSYPEVLARLLKHSYDTKRMRETAIMAWVKITADFDVMIGRWRAFGLATGGNGCGSAGIVTCLFVAAALSEHVVLEARD